MICMISAAHGRELRGVWVVPESVLKDDRPHSLEEKRGRVAEALDQMARRKVNTVLLETFVRGYATVRAFTPLGAVDIPERYRPATRNEPDLLDLFISEGRGRGMEVHAWVHACYLRSDNPARVRADDDTLSLFHDALVRELRDAGGHPMKAELQSMLATALGALERGYDTRSLKDAFWSQGYGLSHEPLQALIDELHDAGIPGPSFLAYDSRGRLHPPVSQVANGSIYLDPSHPLVMERIPDVVESIALLHPGLAGVHLDHIRYPEGSYGHRPETGPDGAITFRPPARGDREAAVASLVQECRNRLPDGLKLSAAVLPAYYSGGSSSRNAQRGAGQDWYKWGLDFYTPMLYGYRGKRLSRILSTYRRDLGSGATVHPGVKSLSQAGGRSSWVLFDYGNLD